MLQPKLKLKWDTRTRTKIIIIALIWIGLLITFLVIGLPLLGLRYPQLIAYRENISAIVVSLTTGGAGMFVFHVTSVAKENTKNPLPSPQVNKKREEGDG